MSCSLELVYLCRYFEIIGIYCLVFWLFVGSSYITQIRGRSVAVLFFSVQESALHHSFFLKKFGLSTSASHETSSKENGNTVPSSGGSATAAEPTAETNGQTRESGLISGCWFSMPAFNGEVVTNSVF